MIRLPRLHKKGSHKKQKGIRSCFLPAPYPVGTEPAERKAGELRTTGQNPTEGRSRKPLIQSSPGTVEPTDPTSGQSDQTERRNGDTVPRLGEACQPLVKEIGDYVGLHYSRVSRIVKQQQLTKGKT